MRRDISVEPEQDCRASSAPEERDLPEPETNPVEAPGFNPAENDPAYSGVSTPETGPNRRPRNSQKPIRLEYHEPQCTICNHPEREDIDQAILHWHSPTAIAFEFGLPDRRIVYRHGHSSPKRRPHRRRDHPSHPRPLLHRRPGPLARTPQRSGDNPQIRGRATIPETPPTTSTNSTRHPSPAPGRHSRS
jgi:hypothetical protein